MKSHHLFLLSIIGLFLGSCKYDPGTGDSTTIQQLFPMSYGNYWVYDAQELDTNGNVANETTVTYEILASQTVNGHQGYLADFGGGSGVLYYSGNDLVSMSTDSVFSSSQTVLRYPMAIGSTLTIRDTTIFDSRDFQQLKFVGPFESVTVPKGTFICYHYQSISIYGGFGPADTTMSDIYFAPGIGLVEEKNYGSNSGKLMLRAVVKLTSYRVQ